MTTPLSVPDEFVQGLFNSAPALWQALAATVGNQFASPAAASALPSAPPAAVGGALQEAQLRYWQQQMALWAGLMASATGQAHEPVAAPERGDRRFSANEWRDNPFYSLLKQSYLLNARLLNDMIEVADTDAKTKQDRKAHV